MKTKRAFKSRLVSVLFLVVGISVFFSYSVSSAQPITLKLGFVTAASEGDPYFTTAKKFSELIESYTKGKYKITMFPSGQLGNENEMVKNMTMGSMDLGVITAAVVGSFVKPFMVFDLPFILPTREVAHKVLDGDAGKMVLSSLSKLNIVGLGFSEGGFRYMVNNVRPINTPEDTKGIKFRVMTTPIFVQLFQSLGSNAVPLPWGEVFTAVQQKVVDGLEIPLAVIYANKYNEVTKYLSMTGHCYSALVIMCSEQRWKKFSAEEKEIFKRAAREAADYERNVVKNVNEEMLSKLKAAGMIINDVPNKKPFQDAVKPMYQKFGDEIGKDVVQAVLKASEDALKK
jgi:tripartite ATP-independent transporter DctP family solute receptor